MSEQDRRRFCASLGGLVQPDRPAEAVDALVKMLPMLSDLPDEAFTSRSCLDAVASCKRRTIVPSYQDIRAAMGEWWRENKVGQRALAAPGTESLNDTDRLWLSYFRKREGENFGAAKGLNGMTYPPSNRRLVLSLVRSQSAAAAAVIEGERGSFDRGSQDAGGGYYWAADQTDAPVAA